MSDAEPKPEPKPELRRIGDPPKPPTRVTLDLMDESGEPLKEDEPLAELAVALPNAMETWHQLFRLDGGGRPLKRASLELSLDRNILLLAKLVPKLEEPFVAVVRRWFREFRDYRLQHPRTGPSNPEQAEQARKVLDEFAPGV